MIQKLQVTLLVTDKDVRVLGGGELEDSEIRDAVSEAVRWRDARAVEVRMLTFPVALLEAPKPQTAEPKLDVAVPQDVRALVESEMRRRYRHAQNEAWDLFLDALEPGDYRVTREPGVRGLRKLP